MKFKIEKRELLFAVTGIIFLLIWFLFLKPLIAPSLSGIFSFLAMIIYNIGTLIGLFFVASILDSKKTRIKASIIAFLVLMGEDLIMAPYVVSTAGIINTNVDYWFVSTDAGWGSLHQLWVPAIANSWNWLIAHTTTIILPGLDLFVTSGYLIWIFTYIITPILISFVIPIIIGNPKLIRNAFR
jgi:hypothetical protein